MLDDDDVTPGGEVPPAEGFDARADELAASVGERQAGVPPYGPPTTEGTDTGQSGASAGTSGTTVSGTSGSAAGATGTTTTDVGGAPSWESGKNVAAPTLTGISPTSAVKNSGDFSLTATGTNVVATTVIMFGGIPQDTVYISPTQCRATIANGASAGNVAGTKSVTLQNGPNASSAQTFTYT